MYRTILEKVNEKIKFVQLKNIIFDLKLFLKV